MVDFGKVENDLRGWATVRGEKHRPYLYITLKNSPRPPTLGIGKRNYHG